MKSVGAIKLYDFDLTIYDGDSTIDFYVFCVRHQPGLLRYLPYQLFHLVLFVFRLENTTRFKSHFFIFLHGLHDVDATIERFWQQHFADIKQWYQSRAHDQDVIISSSPEFLLAPVCQKLGVQTLIATKMDKRSGIIEGLNYKGEEKARQLRQRLPNVVVEEAYSDSLVDRPILKLAKQAFLVKGERVEPFRD